MKGLVEPMDLNIKNIKKYLATTVPVTMITAGAITATVSAIPNTHMEIYIPDDTISIESYNTAAFIRCEGGLVETVDGELVVRSFEGGEFWLSFRITEDIKNIEELSDKNWYCYFDIQGAMLDEYSTEAITASTDYADCLVRKRYTPENPYQEYDLIQIKFIPDSPLTAKTYITSAGTSDDSYENVNIPIYTEKTYETLKAENERLIAQAKEFQEILDYLNSEKVTMKDVMLMLSKWCKYEYSDAYWEEFEKDYYANN